jgi:hypothetical protein
MWRTEERKDGGEERYIDGERKGIKGQSGG